MATGEDDSNDDAPKDRRSLRVAHRAVKRGRKLRVSLLPPPSEQAPLVEDDQQEDTVETAAHAGPSIEVRESLLPEDIEELGLQRISLFARPSAPMLALGGAREEGEAEARTHAPEPVRARARPEEGLARKGSPGADHVALPESGSHPSVQEPPFPETTLVSSPSFEASKRAQPHPVQVIGDTSPSRDEDKRGPSASAPPWSSANSSRPLSSKRIDGEPASTPASKPLSSRGSQPASSKPLSSNASARATVASLEQRMAPAKKRVLGGALFVVAIFFLVKLGLKDDPPAPPVATAAATAAPKPPPPKVTATAVATGAPLETAEPVVSARPRFSEDDYKTARDKTVNLLTQLKYREAQAYAQQLIEMKPTDAFGYRCLGASLQDQGKMAEAKAVYSDCVQKAVTGDVAECARLGGGLRK